MVLSNVFSILYSESFKLNKKAVYSGLSSEVYTPKQKYFENHQHQKKKKNEKMVLAQDILTSRFKFKNFLFGATNIVKETITKSGCIVTLEYHLMV